MRNTTTIILLLLMLMPLAAQDFNTHWVYASQADSLSHVWFRRAYISEGTPRQASITVATTGYYKLYVNECNVGTALYYPLRHGNDSTPISITFDATPYLRPDTNVVAIIYSAVTPSLSKRQLSVTVYGIDHNGKRFSHISDKSWICRRANSSMTENGGEYIDGRMHDPSWKAATIYDLALWRGAEDYDDTSKGSMLVYNQGYHAIRTSKVTSLGYLHISQNPVILHLAHSFWGFPRITLREARRGERLQIGSLNYICSGELDEQAFPVFFAGSNSTIYIAGDKRFKPRQVTAIDLVETSEGWFQNY